MDGTGRAALSLLEALIKTLEAKGVLTPENVAEIYDVSVALAVKAELSLQDIGDPDGFGAMPRSRLN